MADTLGKLVRVLASAGSVLHVPIVLGFGLTGTFGTELGVMIATALGMVGAMSVVHEFEILD